MVREVIVQRVEKTRERHHAAEDGTTTRRRPEEWSDPWMRSKSPSRKAGHRPRKTSYSSGSSSFSSRSGWVTTAFVVSLTHATIIIFCSSSTDQSLNYFFFSVLEVPPIQLTLLILDLDHVPCPTPVAPFLDLADPVPLLSPRKWDRKSRRRRRTVSSNVSV